ncbi:DUF1405 domain-containing protein [Halorhabdus sp. CBA1104]|uniref:DUF1405 domain-containing protein n=1 Tax=unclassified Halorhabdus TaxID=2621901 RepID=UPI0012B3BC30|nr:MULTISPECIES: DUF1405 domain-containing protein [unclassified Halorhabdus]QGN07639.1 DUF1405 domain-containing protein [Halorhabdus sp. CBA1104]
MTDSHGPGRRPGGIVARYTSADLPQRGDAPRYVAPLPAWLEDVGLGLAWPIAIVNLVGTVFGVWYYAGRPLDVTPPLIEGQLGAAPLAAWPLIPDSPVATLLIGLSLIAWRLDLDVDWLHVLAFFGCIKLGFWTPFVQLFLNGPEGIATWLYVFLIGSHLAMALEAFVIHRYATFSLPAIGLAVGWYGLNDLVDYFWPVLDGPHHTWLRAEPYVNGAFDHTVAAHHLAAIGAVGLTVLATVLALLTHRIKQRE